MFAAFNWVISHMEAGPGELLFLRIGWEQNVNRGPWKGENVIKAVQQQQLYIEHNLNLATQFVYSGSKLVSANNATKWNLSSIMIGKQLNHTKPYNLKDSEDGVTIGITGSYGLCPVARMGEKTCI
jgi:hypothetical protein